MDMEELEKSIKASLYSRLGSPFTSAFIVSWLVYNWVFWSTLLFNAAGVGDRVEYLNKIYTTDWFLFGNSDLFYIGDVWIWKGVILPVISAVVVVAFVPRLTIFIYGVHLDLKKRRIDLKRAIEGETLLTEKESEEIMDRIYQARVEIRGLKEEIDKHDDNLKRAYQQNENELEQQRSIHHSEIEGRDEIITKLKDEIEVLKNNADRTKENAETKVESNKPDKQNARSLRRFADECEGQIEGVVTNLIDNFYQMIDEEISLPTTRQVNSKMLSTMKTELHRIAQNYGPKISADRRIKEISEVIGQIDDNLYEYTTTIANNLDRVNEDGVENDLMNFFTPLRKYCEKLRVA